MLLGWMCHGLALHEAVETAHLQAKAVELLLQISTPCLHLGSHHLEGDKALFDLLLDLEDTALKTAAVSLDCVREACLHALELVQHHTEVGINIIARPRST
jgi:hypothetical protein